MTDLGGSGQTTVNSLRLHPGRLDPMTARLRVASLLDSADLQPPGMPPSAILVVRSIADPLPGSVALHSHSVRVDPTWERAVRSALADASRHAARPARGSLPAGAEAVLFADEGEMVACLALDLVERRAPERWWWRSTLAARPLQAGDGLCLLLCERPRSVPPALHHLAAWGRAGAVAAALSPSQAMGVLSAVMRAHGFPALRLDEPESAPALQIEAGVQTSRPSPEPGAMTGRVPHPPWERLLPPGAVPRTLSREGACLLGAALALHRAPAVVRSDRFTRELRAWWSATAGQAEPEAGKREGSGPPGEDAWPAALRQREQAAREAAGRILPVDGPSGSDGGRRVDAPASPRTVPRDLGRDSRVGAFHETPARPSMSPHDGRSGDPRPEDQPDREGVSRNAPTRAARRGAAPAPGPSTGEASDDRGSCATPWEAERAELGNGTASGAAPREIHPPEIERQADTLPEPSDAAREGFQLLLEGGAETQLAGVLYLINLMCHLDLPDCFEEEWGLATQVGPWGVLELLGRALLQRHAAAMSDDPLWEALAVLAGREPGTLPGEMFAGEGDLRLPSTWLMEGTDPRSETDVWATREALSGPLLAGLNPHLARWLALILPYIRARLCRALHIEPAGLEETLLLLPGRLYVSATHVDLVMSLDAISIPLRVAGLDCDPGWLPDFGRVVKFYFE